MSKYNKAIESTTGFEIDSRVMGTSLFCKHTDIRKNRRAKQKHETTTTVHPQTVRMLSIFSTRLHSYVAFDKWYLLVGGAASS